MKSLLDLTSTKISYIVLFLIDIVCFLNPLSCFDSAEGCYLGITKFEHV